MKSMKRLLALIMAPMLALGAIGALAEANGAVKIDKAHFPDAIFRKYVRSFDLDGNGSLSLSERKAVKGISVMDKGISSLRGMEYFPESVALLANNNRLKQLDLSKNKKLLVIMVDGNRLTELNLSKFKALIAVACEDNRLKKLTLGDKPNLLTVRCKGNKLERLDIKRSPKIIDLLDEEPTVEDGVLTWGEERNLTIDQNMKLTAGKKVLYKP